MLDTRLGAEGRMITKVSVFRHAFMRSLVVLMLLGLPGIPLDHSSAEVSMLLIWGFPLPRESGAPSGT